MSIIMPFGVAHLNVTLFGHAVQVLVQAVQQEGEELLGVLLRVPLELGRKLGQLPLEVLGGDVGGARGPELSHQAPKRQRQLPAQAEGVVDVAVLLVRARQEDFQQGHCQ